MNSSFNSNITNTSTPKKRCRYSPTSPSPSTSNPTSPSWQPKRPSVTDHRYWWTSIANQRHRFLEHNTIRSTKLWLWPERHCGKQRVCHHNQVRSSTQLEDELEAVCEIVDSLKRGIRSCKKLISEMHLELSFDKDVINELKDQLETADRVIY